MKIKRTKRAFMDLSDLLEVDHHEAEQIILKAYLQEADEHIAGYLVETLTPEQLMALAGRIIEVAKFDCLHYDEYSSRVYGLLEEIETL